MVCLKFLTIGYFEIRRLISKGDFVGSNFNISLVPQHTMLTSLCCSRG